MERAEGIHEKNGVNCLFIMFTSIVMVLKMSEISIFLSFLLITAKSLSQFVKFLSVHKEDNIELLQKMVWLINFGLNCS